MIKTFSIVLTVLCLISAAFAGDADSALSSIVGKHKVHGCNLEVRDLEKVNPLGYQISFPEWKYQLIFDAERGRQETIVSEDDFDIDYMNEGAYVQNDKLVVLFSKGNEWGSKNYRLIISRNGKQVTGYSLSLGSKFLGSWSEKVRCY